MAIIDVAATIKTIVKFPVDETLLSSPGPRQALSDSKLRYDAYEVPSISRSTHAGRSVLLSKANSARSSMNGVPPMSAGQFALMDEDERQDVSLQLPTEVGMLLAIISRAELKSDRLGLDLDGLTLGDRSPGKPSPRRRQSNDPFTSSPI